MRSRTLCFSSPCTAANRAGPHSSPPPLIVQMRQCPPVARPRLRADFSQPCHDDGAAGTRLWIQARPLFSAPSPAPLL
ncbi:hypothetical protein BDY17DRAFT_301921 [Neohortaea acidophila]|uniref:Uncharacterized protein n=1 Tax=Neohortaea acidophila TaxID=245834 RepID=A0A6A6PMN5_9PEZI|nr:uncharacterized protein BDY17DRAFT_301921 [Neohortaea acidophila]KAF2480517.1 hypothetical protein BDY17DRAFT_301921 [Neohortaea acidophila]